jgi:hypothetical protein
MKKFETLPVTNPIKPLFALPYANNGLMGFVKTFNRFIGKCIQFG